MSETVQVDSGTAATTDYFDKRGGYTLCVCGERHYWKEDGARAIQHGCRAGGGTYGGCDARHQDVVSVGIFETVQQPAGGQTYIRERAYCQCGADVMIIQGGPKR